MNYFEVQDRNEREIEMRLSHSVMNKTCRDVYDAFNQIVNKNLLLGEGNIIDADPIQATQILQESVSSIEKELNDWVQGYSSMRWLWMLRRLPRHIFAGKLSSTAPYDQTLAEIFSAQSNQFYSGLQRSDSQIHYDISGAVLTRLARFCAGIKYLSDLHSYLRWAGKGSRFHFSSTSMPKVISDKDLEKAVNLYDQRRASSGMPFSRGGTRLANLVVDQLTSTDILRVDRMQQEDISLPNEFMQTLGAEFSSNTYWKLRVNFMPSLVSLAPLQDLQKDQRLRDIKIWSSDAGIVALLLRIAPIYLKEHRAGLFSLCTRGYLLIPKIKFLNLADELLSLHDSWINETLINKPNLKSGVEFLLELESLKGISYPLKPGPVLRTDQDMICLDLAMATQRLDCSFEYTNAQGKTANARAYHFEITVQKSIDSSQWKPKPEIAKFRGRDLFLNGKKITDIDSIGEKDGKLLIVDCKSIIYSSNYDIGDYTTVRNTRTEIERKVKEWQKVKETLKQNPVGDNYNFSKYRDILAVVCIPGVVFLHIGSTTEEIDPNLRVVSSLIEIEKWLGINPQGES
ncbi:MAG: hypothetical protein SFY66_15825 [Oculatellaceae cyanobacterium bins.114]|nr:hypothetical protein [Oculatellaceae cyanobacterium bins.114]